MKYLNILLCFTVAFLILASCVNEPKKSDKPASDKNQPSIIKETDGASTHEKEQVSSIDDGEEHENNQTETLFPKDVKPTKALPPFSVFEPKIPAGSPGLPVIIFLDAHANGNQPVTIYRLLANKYHFLLVGSNEIKNGMPGNEIIASFDKLLNTVKSDFPIDKDRIYLMGFSGGARLGLAFAEAYPEISAMVACGAGIQVGVKAPEPTFSFMGMAGNEDFNMIEIINTDRLLKREKFNCAMVLFDGDHNWPPPDVAEEIFLWLDLIAMKDKSKAIDQIEINTAKDWYLQKVNTLKTAGRIFDSYEVTERATEVLDGLTDVSKFKILGEELRKNPVYNEQINEMVKTIQMEMGLQNSYLQAFKTKDVAWWANEMQKLNNSTVSKTEQLMQKRLLAYLGVMAYMMSDKAVSDKNPEASEKYLKIYRLIEPTNPEHVYLEAKRRMALNEETKALEYLRLAVMLGFKDKYRLYNDPVFNPLNDNPDFESLLK